MAAEMGLDELGPLGVDVWVIPLDDPDKRRRRELAHLAQRRILAGYLGVEPGAVAYATAPGSAKPLLAGGALQFNLSHSGELALVAVSRELPVGVDLERPRELRDPAGLGRRICTPRELEHLAQAGDPDELLRLWVRKEAVAKASGEGLVRALDGLDVLERRVEGGWLCFDLAIPEPGDAPGYRAAVATRDRPGVSVVLRGRFSPAADPRR